jgi:hypothetical protein
MINNFPFFAPTAATKCRRRCSTMMGMIAGACANGKSEGISVHWNDLVNNPNCSAAAAQSRSVVPSPFCPHCFLISSSGLLAFNTIMHAARLNAPQLLKRSSSIATRFIGSCADGGTSSPTATPRVVTSDTRQSRDGTIVCLMVQSHSLLWRRTIDPRSIKVRIEPPIVPLPCTTSCTNARSWAIRYTRKNTRVSTAVHFELVPFLRGSLSGNINPCLIRIRRQALPATGGK